MPWQGRRGQAALSPLHGHASPAGLATTAPATAPGAGAGGEGSKPSAFHSFHRCNFANKPDISLLLFQL